MSVVTKIASIGFVGLGNLGEAMSLNLVEKEWPLRVHDTSEAREKAVTDAGATSIAASDLAECDVVCLAVPDDDVVWQLVRGADGLANTLQPGQTVIVHSTILPSTARELATLFAQAGVGFLDAPVSGGAERARHGELALMVGGTEDDLERVRPLLESMSSEIFHLGPAGAGSATKLANQLIMFAALGGIHEALKLASVYGVGETDVLTAVSAGTGDTWVGRNWGFFDEIVAAYDLNQTPVSQRPWSKDLHEIVAAGQEAEKALPIAALLAGTLANEVEAHAKRTQDSKGEPR